ncbi:monofunctional biosynthetic peptidoglycan transglycosylase [Breoghania sp. L-A4]|uniref:monofunctional biosynthetic peptidoglycan transglycosylase n=1 Tax=Breoghania sp. L-A4 TaxID=2304600 RepID=UPI000E3598AB|nr:monofunctional biosynthetic peptidoglycan transglycosylase [Breoghania sp. L-A4]AXS38854.1 monofunctional biosynthetic peptidoglycan transglycosylase [Breoghania sp. L-A4]
MATARGKTAGSAARRRKVWRLTRIALRIGVFLCLAPLVLTVAYAFLPAMSAPMMARLVTLQKVERIWTPLDGISPTLVRAVVASEDARFCSHPGVDWEALEDQLSKLEDGERPRGASTITMQLAKNLFLWPGRSYLRKGLEIPLALWIDLVLSKRRILELYLNVAEWGDGVFGAEAAARRHFGKSASELSRSEAARLATALPNPILRNPANPSKRHSAHARTIRGRATPAQVPVDCLALEKG